MKNKDISFTVITPALNENDFFDAITLVDVELVEYTPSLLLQIRII